MGRPAAEPGGQVGFGAQVAASEWVRRNRVNGRNVHVHGWVVRELCGAPQRCNNVGREPSSPQLMLITDWHRRVLPGANQPKAPHARANTRR